MIIDVFPWPDFPVIEILSLFFKSIFDNSILLKLVNNSLSSNLLNNWIHFFFNAFNSNPLTIVPDNSSNINPISK